MMTLGTMKFSFSPRRQWAVRVALLSLAAACQASWAQAPQPPQPSLTINLAQAGPHVPSHFYGLMTEEINHSYDGGLYAELIRNRNFRDNPQVPSHWSLIQDGGAEGALSLDQSQPLSAALPVSLRLDITHAGGRVGVANKGYWGIPIRPGTTYHASFFAKAAPGFTGPITLTLESTDGRNIYARGQVSRINTRWQRYAITLKTFPTSPAQPLLGRFTLTAEQPGTVWLDLVSLFPPTFKNQPHGFRPDLMEKMAAMRPSFLRLPGGNYLEGSTIAERFNWKKTIGPLTQRPGHFSPWGYRSTDGLGLLEFLEWCEDLKMEPVLAVYAGYSLQGEHVDPGPALQPYVQDALDEIEYVTGSTDTKWGAERARDGHPKPFSLEYVEIGNEDGADKSGSYAGRFAQFFDAIKAKYPQLKLISTTGGRDWLGQQQKVTLRTPDVVDEHYYQSAEEMERQAHRFDTYSRTGPKVFVGEWASFDRLAPWQMPHTSLPTPDLNEALGDAAWMTGMERNCDVVVMESYAPLLVNINPGAFQWMVNLIGYDALTSYGSPSYYVQVMFGQNHGNVVVPATLVGDHLFESVTRDTTSGEVYVKLVNTAEVAQTIQIMLNGARRVDRSGTAITLSGTALTDTNTITDPTRIVPVTSSVSDVSRAFTDTLAPYSITVLKLHIQKM